MVHRLVYPGGRIEERYKQDYHAERDTGYKANAKDENHVQDLISAVRVITHHVVRDLQL